MTNHRSSKSLDLAGCLASLGFNFPRNETELTYFEASNNERLVINPDKAVNPFKIIEQSRAEDIGKLVAMDGPSYSQVAFRPVLPELPALPEHILNLWKRDK